MLPEPRVSVLYREPKLLKVYSYNSLDEAAEDVSVLYREPKLLKESDSVCIKLEADGFSALP